MPRTTYDNQGVDRKPAPKAGERTVLVHTLDQPYTNPVLVTFPPLPTCQPNSLARVAGRTCFRSMSEMEHRALALLAYGDNDTEMTSFLEDVVRLARQVGDRNTDSIENRPGNRCGP